jgi:hypothetical protein
MLRFSAFHSLSNRLKNSAPGIGNLFRPISNDFLFGAAKKAFWAAIISGLLMQLDPFGMSSAADIQSEKLFSRFISGPNYPTGKDNPAQNKITVILVDKYKYSWPPSYKKQAAWLSEILLHKPKAVFIDFVYDKKHEKDNGLLELTDTIKKSSIPIYIPFLAETDSVTCADDQPRRDAQIRKKDTPIEEIREAILKNGSRYNIENQTFIGWSGCGNRYPLYLGNNTRYPTPALTMFKQYCRDYKDSYIHAARVCKHDLDTIEDYFQKPMAVVWGTQTSKNNQDLFQDFGLPCKSPTFLDHLLQLPGDIFKGVPDRGIRSNCTYTDTVLFSMFNSSTEKVDDPFDPYLKDRYVFVGVDVPLSNDFIINPINGKVAGVYLLAMAFDNLINYGIDYDHDLDKIPKAGLTITILFLSILILEITNLAFKKLENGRAKMFYYLRWISIKVIMPFIFIGLWGFFFMNRHISPADWIGILLATLIFNPVSLNEITKSIWSDIKTWIRNLP